MMSSEYISLGLKGPVHDLAKKKEEDKGKQFWVCVCVGVFFKRCIAHNANTVEQCSLLCSLWSFFSTPHADIGNTGRWERGDCCLVLVIIFCC